MAKRPKSKYFATEDDPMFTEKRWLEIRAVFKKGTLINLILEISPTDEEIK